MATSSDPNSSLPDWTDLYGHNQASASAASAAVGINISSLTSMSMPDLTATSGSGSPPGRIGKSPRRRSRASRRAPVTLLNTDTSNFRAMVQQFTGIPSSSSSSGAYTSGISGSGGGGPTISFSAPNINTMRPSGGGVMSFGGGGQPQQYQYQYQSRQLPFQEQIYHSRQQQQQQQQQYDEYGVGENNNNNNNVFINGARAGAGGYHDMHINNEGIFDTNHAAHSATNIHLRAHDHPYFG